MKKAIAVALSLGLLAGALVMPAEAAKKKKKKKLTPVETKFYMHWDDDGAGGCAGMQHMSTEDTEGDTGCSYTFQAAQEIFISSGASEPLSNVYPASDGVPLILDASKKVTGEFAMRGNFAISGTVEWVLSGATGDDFAEIASGTTEAFNSGPTGATGPVILTIEGEIDPKLDKKVFSSLELATTVRGVTSAYVGKEDPGSFISIPSFTK